MKPHVIFVTETKLCPSDQSSEYFGFSNYILYRKDRVSVDGGGGVAILVRNDLVSESFFENSWNDLEVVACLTRFNSKKLLLVCVYRPPNSTTQYNYRINEIINRTSLVDVEQCLICGDFNFRKIDWNNHLVLTESDTSIEQMFYDETQSSFLHQHVTENTRQRGTDEPSMLDLVFSKNEFEIEEINYLAPIGKSDHSVLMFDYTLEGIVEPDNEEPFVKKKYFRADYNLMYNELVPVRWETMMEDDVQARWDMFLSKHDEVVKKCVPEGLSSGGGPPKSKWMNNQAQQAIDKKK